MDTNDEADKEVESQYGSSPLYQPDFPLGYLRSYWNIYFSSFPPTAFDLALPLHKILFALYCLTKKEYFRDLFPLVNSYRHFQYIEFDYSRYELVLSGRQDDEMAEQLKEILSNFNSYAQVIMQSLCLVIHYWLVKSKQQKEKKVCLIVKNYPLANITDIKANMIENFITIEAVVLKVYQIKLMAISMDFTCTECKSTTTQMMTEGNFSTPNRCRGDTKKNCRSKSFLPHKYSIKSIFVQRLKVQEIDSYGRTPRQVICETRYNMVGRVITGYIVRLSGIIKTETSDEKDKKTQGIFVPYIVVNSVQQKATNSLSPHDKNLIKYMKEDENIFYSLIKSFCPTIYGHEIVKAGLLLAMVGGSNKNLRDYSTFRETSHVLLLGDPGIGKSQLLKFAVEILPHSVYVNATACSNSGLTVTVNKDNNEQSLEAGALILSDNGICAIDYFDKALDSSSLLEVMEQQTVSIAKAGIICQLKCRVGIIASANPISGCYNRAKSFKENTKISNAILSRFDLIFLLVDKPDPERDQKLSEHIMKIHNNKRRRRQDSQFKYNRSYSRYDYFLSLADKYNKISESQLRSYNIDYIKKYLSFVKSEIHPTLSHYACEVIKGFYIALRDNSPANFQITNRQLESLVRLSMARARLECRNVVTYEDALEITQLMQESLFDSFEEMGYNINALKQDVKKTLISKNNGELSLPKQRKLFIAALKANSEDKGSNVWEWGYLIKTAKDLELNIGDFHEFIERLNQDGVLLQRGNKKYAFEGIYL